MKIITHRDKIRAIPAVFERYARGRLNWDPTDECGAVLDRLRALDVETASVKDVREILPNCMRDWVAVDNCRECGERFDTIVMLGDEPDQYSATVYMCRACLLKAAALLEIS